MEVHISECSLLLMRVGVREKAWQLLEILCEEENTHGEEATISAQGTVKASSMNELLDDAIRRGHAENAATCIQLIASTVGTISIFSCNGSKIMESFDGNLKDGRIR